MFGYMNFNVKYYILSQIFYKKMGLLSILNKNKDFALKVFCLQYVQCSLQGNLPKNQRTLPTTFQVSSM